MSKFKHFKYRLFGEAILTGIVGGLMVTAYKYALGGAKQLSMTIYGAATKHPALIAAVFAGLAALAFLTSVLIKIEPLIKGGGIPQVKGQIKHGYKTVWWRIALLKFTGGAISMLCGLGLGREGPSVQLSAAGADGIATTLKRRDTEKRFLIICGAGAGLAAAFNAPFAGALLSLEEFRKDFEPMAVISALAASVAATLTANLLGGTIYSVFSINISSLPLSAYGFAALVGILLGFIGLFYNKTLLAAGDALAKRKIPLFFRLLPAFLIAGAVCLALPKAGYDGHLLLDELLSSSAADTIETIGLLFLVQFIFSIICFASTSPGGNFFPVMVSGALFGTLAALFFSRFLGLPATFVVNFALLGMTGALTAVVRAPITAIVLVLELTGSFSHMLSFVVVALLAYIVPAFFNSPPLYDSLAMRLKGEPALLFRKK